AVLDDFFPRYIKILNLYKDNIAEVRIEGHTSSEWIGSKNNLEAYFNNMKLSQDRTRAVLNYCLNMPAMKEHQAWAISAITANGLSSSKLILNSHGKEDAALSRRVEFRVRTDADKRIMKILEEIK
ncbi:MAG: OmpA family protein, partial [Synergistaceae bacterium]|nr:OmpA family protein [Synergistaceae bacterium]